MSFHLHRQQQHLLISRRANNLHFLLEFCNNEHRHSQNPCKGRQGRKWLHQLPSVPRDGPNGGDGKHGMAKEMHGADEANEFCKPHRKFDQTCVLIIILESAIQTLMKVDRYRHHLTGI